MRKLLALCAIGGVFAVVAASARPPKDVLPDRALTGIASVPLRQVALSLDSSASAGPVDFVFVSADCVVCHAMVTRLAERGARPLNGRRAVFVTDRTWPELDQLRTPNVIILDNRADLERALGVRATPTLISLDGRTRRITQVGVGEPIVSKQFVSTPGVLHPSTPT
jgi:hypothetical protein